MNQLPRSFAETIKLLYREWHQAQGHAYPHDGAGDSDHEHPGTRIAPEDIVGGDHTIHDNVADEFAGVAQKAAPVSADLLLIEDSEDSGAKKRVEVGDLPGGGGGHVIEDEGTPLTQRANMNFVGAGVTAADSGGKTVVTIPGGGGHEIRENGTPQTSRTGLNFIDANAGAGLITDDAGGDETEVNLSLYAGVAQNETITGTWGFGDRVTLSDALILEGHIQDASMPADETNYNPTGLVDAVVVVVQSLGGGDRSINSIALTTDGLILLIINGDSSNNLTLVHESGLEGTAGKRFACPGGANYVLAPNAGVWLYKDGFSTTINQRWRVIGELNHVTAHDVTTGVHGAGANTILHSASAAGGQATGTLGNLTVANTHGASGTQTHHAQSHGDADHSTATVPKGGTGATTLTDRGVLIGRGTAAVEAVTALTKGQLLVGQTGANPTALAIGTDTHVLTLDSAEAAGVKWAAGGAGGADEDARALAIMAMGG